MANNSENCVSVFFNNKACQNFDNCMVFEDKYNEDLYNQSAYEENCMLFEDQYDEDLYNECARVEENEM